MRAEQNSASSGEGKPSFFGKAVEVWRYRLITILLMSIPATVLDNMLRALVNSSGTAITTANLGQLLSWRTLLILALGLLLVLCFLVFEILGHIYLCRDILAGEGGHVFREIGKGIRSVRRFLSAKGLLVVLFITVAVPLCGIGFPISLTKYFYIPNFITSVIFSNPLYTAFYVALIVFLAFVAFRWIFTLHAMLLDGMNADPALKRSSDLMKANWKDFLKRYVFIEVYPRSWTGLILHPLKNVSFDIGSDNTRTI